MVQNNETGKEKMWKENSFFPTQTAREGLTPKLLILCCLRHTDSTQETKVTTAHEVMTNNFAITASESTFFTGFPVPGLF